MTEKETNSCKNCMVCTGCGRGAGKTKGLQAVANLTHPFAKESGGKQANIKSSGEKHYPPLPDMGGEELLLAADIGTTTIVMQLRRVENGEVLQTFRAVNPQRKYGTDVLSRIKAAEDAKVTEDMQNLVRQVLSRGIKELTGEAVKREGNINLRGMVIAANTTMVYLLMGYPTEELGKAPFTARHLEEISTEIGGIDTIILPGLSAFVGGDILAGMYACDVGKSKEMTLFLDLGTNGEMVLGNGNQLLATATAAGPAFEGRLEAGIWGADAIAFLARLYEKGLVDETGLLAEPYFDTGVSIGGTVMTREDIRSLQLAKAAVHGGIQVLCEECGITLEQIEKVYLAGGFGYFLNPGDAVAIGLIPGELERKCLAVGNAALEGAFCYGREAEAGNKIRALKSKTRVYNLASAHKFEQYYIEAISLPERGV